MRWNRGMRYTEHGKHRQRRATEPRLLFERLEVKRMLATDFVISEFLASNDGTLFDEDGEFSDWIEIHNQGDTSGSLEGWHLTDNPADPDKWEFPDVSLDAGEFLVVFASGKDRSNPASELHTNFQLDREGEFLGLVQPNGTTVEHSYTASPQYADVSHGIQQFLPLVTNDADLTAIVPDISTGTSWRGGNEPYNDSDWIEGEGSVGYVQTVNGFLIRSYVGRDGIVISSLDDAEDLLANPNLQNPQKVNILNPTTINLVGVEDYPETGYIGHFGTDVSFPAHGIGQPDIDNYVIEATAKVYIDATGDWTFGVRSDGAFSLSVSDGSNMIPLIEDPDLLFSGDRFLHVFFDTTGWYDLRLVKYDYSGDAELELFSVADNKSSWDSSFKLVGDTGALEAEGIHAPTYEGYGGPPASVDLFGEMYGDSASAYVRIPFEVEDADAFASLSLRLKYTDGFVAYLNGVQIASKNAPGTPAYNSSATAARVVQSALVYEAFANISAALLGDGTNVLAIHGLNWSDDQPDFLIEAELMGRLNTDIEARYLPTTTPGSPNYSTGLLDGAEVTISQAHGFFTTSFQTTITATAGTTIRYTTDGSTPTASHGSVHTSGQSLAINGTTTLRVAAFADDRLPGSVKTETYLFLNDVITQGDAPSGYPSTWGSGVAADYGMDTDIVEDPEYSGVIVDALKAVPTLSIVTDIDNLFDPITGIYMNTRQHGGAWERPVSVELINPDGSEGFQVGAGLRITGGASRGAGNLIHSLRLLFKEKYGPTTLDYALIPGSPVTSFDQVFLRGQIGSTEPSIMPLLADRFIRDTQDAISGDGANGTFMHLYINGMYWGLYGPTEKPRATFLAENFGGDKSDYDVLDVSAGVLDGNADAWKATMAMAELGLGSNAAYQKIQGRDPDGTDNPSYPNYVDVESLMDYMMVVIYGGYDDWPENNGMMARRSRDNGVDINTEPFRFYHWDGDSALPDDANFSYNEWFTSSTQNPLSITRLWSLFRQNDEFKLQFGDRVRKQFFNGGALSEEVASARFAQIAAEMDLAMIPHTARWRHPLGSELYTLENFRDQVNGLLDTYFFADPTNPNALSRSEYLVKNLLVINSMYPNYNFGVHYNGDLSPQLSHFGGSIEASPASPFELTIDAHLPLLLDPVIYYTFDPDMDPRDSSLTITSGESIDITGNSVVRVRVLNANEPDEFWTVMVEAEFTVASLSHLRISEVNYHPAEATQAEATALGVGDPGNVNPFFEFIELVNTSDSDTIEITDVQLVQKGDEGVTFSFADMTTLAPGQRILVVENEDTFEARYGTGLNVAGAWGGGRLSNNQERIQLRDTDGNTIHDFVYNDLWEPTTDGDGHTLVIVNRTADTRDWNLPRGWRPSVNVNGSPGEAEPVVLPVFRAAEGSLTITGTDQADTIALDSVFGLVSLDGKTAIPGPVRAADVALLEIMGGDGNDLISLAALDDDDYSHEDLSGQIEIWGEEGNDTILGSDLADIIHGNSGDDTLYGGDDDDTIYGGVNSYGGTGDVIYGDDGHDTLYGDGDGYGGDNDTIYGGYGGDMIYGQDGIDHMRGEDGNDTMYGGIGADRAYGGAGDDSLYGDAGNDNLWGGVGSDLLYGGTDNDVYGWRTVGPTAGDIDTDGYDEIIESNYGGGIDELHFVGYGSAIDINLASTSWQDILRNGTGGVHIKIANYESIENLRGTQYGDILRGTSQSNYLYGLGGDDIVYGGGGSDILYGGNGQDILFGDDGNDTLYGEEDDDTLYGGSGTDTGSGGNENDSLISIEWET